MQQITWWCVFVVVRESAALVGPNRHDDLHDWVGLRTMVFTTEEAQRVQARS